MKSVSSDSNLSAVDMEQDTILRYDNNSLL